MRQTRSSCADGRCECRCFDQKAPNPDRWARSSSWSRLSTRPRCSANTFSSWNSIGVMATSVPSCVEQFVGVREKRASAELKRALTFDDGLAGAPVPPRGSAQHRLHPGQQFPQIDRLGDIVVGPDLQSDHPVDYLGRPGQHDDRDVRMLAQIARQGEAILAGHPDVEDHRIDVLGVDDLAQGRARVGRRDGKAIALQIFRHGLANIRFVVTDNDVRARGQRFVQQATTSRNMRLRMRRQINKHRVQ